MARLALSTWVATVCGALVLLPATAPAAVKPGYYLGKTTCAPEADDCIAQENEALFLVQNDRSYRFKSSVSCRRSDTSETRAVQVEVFDNFAKSGHFDTGGLFGQNDLWVRGAIGRASVDGTIDFVAKHDPARSDGPDWECPARGVGFSAHRLAKGLFRSGGYTGTTSCDDPPGLACAPSESHPASLELRKNKLRDMKVELRCADDSSGVPEDRTRTATALATPIRWDGAFAYRHEAHRESVYFRGVARRDMVTGHAQYTRTADLPGGGGYTVCIGQVAFSVSRDGGGR